MTRPGYWKDLCRQPYRKEIQKLSVAKRKEYYAQYHADFYRENWVKLAWYRSKRRALREGKDFSLLLSDMPVVPDCCPILGIPLIVGRKKGAPTWNSPSLDRIRSDMGYITGNVQIISYRANSLKSDATIEELEKVLASMKRAT